MNCRLVIVRELRRMSRRRTTFYKRALVCALAMFVLGVISVWMDWTDSTTIGFPLKGTIVFRGSAVLLGRVHTKIKIDDGEVW